MSAWAEDVPRVWPGKLVARFARTSHGSALKGRDAGDAPTVAVPGASRPLSARRLLLVTADGRPVYEDAERTA